MKIKCDCGKIAVWCYMPGFEGAPNDCFCDDCVPRGCSCNDRLKDDLKWETMEEYGKLWENDDNIITDLDEQGRQLPCCEYLYEEEGFEI